MTDPRTPTYAAYQAAFGQLKLAIAAFRDAREAHNGAWIKPERMDDLPIAAPDREEKRLIRDALAECRDALEVVVTRLENVWRAEQQMPAREG